MTPPADVAARITAWPDGTTKGRVGTRRYVASRSSFGTGRAIKLVAEELGGADYISMNLYQLAAGPQLYPCEMSSDKVIAFVRGFEPDAEQSP